MIPGCRRGRPQSCQKGLLQSPQASTTDATAPTRRSETTAPSDIARVQIAQFHPEQNAPGKLGGCDNEADRRSRSLCSAEPDRECRVAGVGFWSFGHRAPADLLVRIAF